MIKKTKLSALSLMLALLMPAALAAASLADFSTKENSLSEHVGGGKWVVVMLWASYCHVCNEEAHQYNQFHEDHKERDARVIGLSLDGAEGRSDAEAFVRRHRITFPNLIGEPGEIAGLYRELTGTPWLGTPSFLIYGPDGKLAAKQEGAVPVHLIEGFISKSAGTD